MSTTRTSIRGHPALLQIERRLATARSVLELTGCEDPHLAWTGLPHGGWRPAAGARIVRSPLVPPLPFGDREFDFALCVHAFGDLDDPGKACDEIARVARAGVVVAPSVFAEAGRGRGHRWVAMDGGDELFLFEKTVWEGGRPSGARTGGACRPRAAEAAKSAPAAAFETVFVWTATLRHRVVQDFPQRGRNDPINRAAGPPARPS